MTSSTGGRVALATIRMNVHGQDRAFAVPVPLGPSRLLDLLPASGAIASEEAQANIEDARAHGKEISCRAGCGACCRQAVAISAVEAQALAELVDTFPAERQSIVRERFQAGIRRLEEAGLLDPSQPPGHRYPQAADQGALAQTLNDLGRRYFRLGVACPFLEDESCGIYEQRPAVCREYHVTSPAENCARLYEVPVDRLEPSFHVSEILGHLAEGAAAISQSSVLLIQALEWSAANFQSLAATGDGRQLFGMFMDEIGKLAADRGAHGLK
jgi:Fe-S-cluster containining protein